MKQAPPILTALRTATRADHDRLEAMTLGDRIMDGSLTLDEYERIVDWQRRSHLALEPLVDGFRTDRYAYRRRFPDGAADAGTSPADRATAVGTLYVLEGSSLGGSMIYRKLLENPALAPAAPFAFYRDQADWGISQWRDLMAYLQEQPFNEEETARAVAAAHAAFGRFAAEWETDA